MLSELKVRKVKLYQWNRSSILTRLRATLVSFPLPCNLNQLSFLTLSVAAWELNWNNPEQQCQPALNRNQPITATASALPGLRQKMEHKRNGNLSGERGAVFVLSQANTFQGDRVNVTHRVWGGCTHRPVPPKHGFYLPENGALFPIWIYLFLFNFSNSAWQHVLCMIRNKEINVFCSFFFFLVAVISGVKHLQPDSFELGH